ncbi:MAG TPA: citrate synthase [Chloroflexi bacterium]|nr:citrate synthase [Chloroflexota bacterium]
MTLQSAPVSKGLEGIVIAQSRLSKVDGSIGKLQYCGYNIKDLAANALFEEVIFLLWNYRLPTQSELDTFRADLAAQRVLEPELLGMMKQFPKGTHPMSVLRTVVSAIGMFDPEAEDNSPEANQRKAARLASVMPTIVAAWERIRNDEEPIAPRDDLTLATNFLYMLKGTEPTETETDAVNTYLVLLADHGMNASTFSARVTTSTLSDIYSAITTAIGTLKGPAHGGANQKAMEQFMEIGSPDNVDAWFEQAMENKRRIMGIGHRVYKTEDPRATILRERSKALAESSGDRTWYEIAWRLEQRARSHEFFIERNLFANVDYYSAIVLYQVGIPVDLFTPLFAMSRVAGWSAHVMEQWADNRLIRPRAEYVGPEDLAWVPIEERG